MNDTELMSLWSALEPSTRRRARIETRVFEWLEASETSLVGGMARLAEGRAADGIGLRLGRRVIARAFVAGRLAGVVAVAVGEGCLDARRYRAGSSSKPCSKCSSQFCAHGRPK